MFSDGASLFLIGIVSAGVCPVSAEVLTTTDFESGDLSGWTAFPTSNGTLGGEGFPSVAVCDHAGMVSPSWCLQVQVGQLHYAPAHDVQQGGGIERTPMTGANHLLNRTRWPPLRGAKILLFMLLPFIPNTSPFVLLIDETLERRKGKKIKAKGNYREAVR